MTLLRFSRGQWCFGAVFGADGRLERAAPAYRRVCGAQTIEAARVWWRSNKAAWTVEKVG
jgi:hypothetical protein